ncbi:hypothetical protein M885DRAFT_563702 [Pelagophyceae sp. CCMP2097]|nr:hypothetical protein M885DRAFT_563702 [Pelagophyceae sp. CCMP2097]
MRSPFLLAVLLAPTAPLLLHRQKRVQTRVRVHDADSEVQGGFRYDNQDSISPLEKKQALENTAQWCLDRCIKLGHCEVLEDLNKMTFGPAAAQVQDFCKACVLSGENTNDECEISFMFTEDAPWAGVKPPDGINVPDDMLEA